MRLLLGAITLVLMITAAGSILALAGSGALGLAPSLSHYQLLSMIDIAYATAGIYLGMEWWFGFSPALVAAALLFGAWSQ